MIKVTISPLRRYSLRHLTAATLAIAVAGCASKSTPARAQVDPAVIPATVRTPLDDYIERPEPAYKWEKTSQKASGNVTEYDLKVTSQEWQGTTWTHRVQVFRPAKVKFTDTAMVLASFGGGTMGETFVGQAAANATGATVVNIFHIPNQPLFGQREDALIALSFAKFLETNDANWPLLFPMTKSIVKAMDAVQEFSTQEWKQPITKFVVGGGSKRGWTSWLAAAVDKRVVAITPMVYDNLNLAQQMPHQLEVWGQYSSQIQDYTRIGLQEKLGTPRGQELARMVDPYTYLNRITVPKLVINATNDAYWPLDAAKLYRDAIKGPTNFMYVPNVGHAMVGQELRVAAATTGWVARIASGGKVPEISLKADAPGAGGARSFTVWATPGTVQLWVAQSATQDFRKAKWEAVAAKTEKDGVHTAQAPALAEGMKYAAAFAEVELPAENALLAVRVTSGVEVWGG